MQPEAEGRIASPDSDVIAVRRLLRSSAAMALARAAGVLTLLLAVPVIVGRLGPDAFGVWEALLAIGAVAMLLQAGIGGTLLWQISLSYGQGDAAETRRLVRVGVGIGLLATAMVLPWCIAYRGAILQALQTPPHLEHSAGWLLPTMVALMLLGGINESLSAVLIGYQRAGTATLIQSLGLAVSNLLSVGLLLAGWGLEALFLGSLCGFAVMLSGLWRVAGGLCGAVTLFPALPLRRDLATAGPFLGLLLASNLTLVVCDQADKILAASLASTATVAYLAIAQRVVLGLSQTCPVFTTPFIAAAGALHAQGNAVALRTLYAQVALRLATIVGVLTVLTATLRDPLSTLWLGAPQPAAFPFLAWLLFGYATAIIFTGAGVALAKATGRPGLETSYALVTLALTLVSKPLLVHLAGPVGAVASSAISWSLGAVLLLALVHHAYSIEPRVTRRLVGIWLLTLLLSAAGWYAAGFVPASSGRLGAALTLSVCTLPVAGLYLGLLADCDRLLSSKGDPPAPMLPAPHFAPSSPTVGQCTP